MEVVNEEADHDYSFQPPAKKIKTGNKLEDQYQETLTVLREINQTIASGLEQINDSITNLTKTIKKNQNID